MLEHGAIIDQKTIKETTRNQKILQYFELTQELDRCKQCGAKFYLNPKYGNDQDLYEFAKRLVANRKIKFCDPKILKNHRGLKKFSDVEFEFNN